MGSAVNGSSEREGVSTMAELFEETLRVGKKQFHPSTGTSYTVAMFAL